jgi:hypothetical protein
MNNVRTVMLSAAIVEESELIWVCCGWRVDLFLFSRGCWRQQPHENKNNQHATHNTLKSVPALSQ